MGTHHCHVAARLERIDPPCADPVFGFAEEPGPQEQQRFRFLVLDFIPDPARSYQLKTSPVEAVFPDPAGALFRTVSGSWYCVQRIELGELAHVFHRHWLNQAPLPLECFACGRTIAPGEDYAIEPPSQGDLAGFVAALMPPDGSRLDPEGKRFIQVRCHPCYRRHVVRLVGG